MTSFAVADFQVQGAWTRRSVSIDGSEPFETQRVYWLQSGSVYADLRVPFHPAAATGCFAGSSGWDGDRFRWSHRLDLAHPAGAVDDIGDLVWDGDCLIERGVLGGFAYEEVWARLPGDDGEADAVETPDGCVVQVGSHAIVVVDARHCDGEFSAAYWKRTDEGWQVGASIGDAAGLRGLGACDFGCVHTGNRTRLGRPAR